MKLLNTIQLYKIILFVGTIAAVITCTDDKGNYTYSDIDEIGITNLVKSATYTVNQFDTLTIEPVVTHSLDQESDFEYIWYTADGDTIALTKTLHNPIYLDPNKTYSAFFAVRHKTLKYYQNIQFYIKVNPSNSIPSGLLVLSDRSGEASLSYLGETMNLFDIEKGIVGGIGRNPVRVNYHFQSKTLSTPPVIVPPLVSVMCNSDSGGIVLSGSYLNKLMPYSNLFFTPISNPKPQFYGFSNEFYKLSLTGYSYIGNYYREFIVDNNMIYERYFMFAQGKGEGAIKFQPAMLPPKDGLGVDIHPNLIIYPSGSSYAGYFAFDRKNKRFVQCSGNYPFYNLEASVRVKPSDSTSWNPQKVTGPDGDLISASIGYANENSKPYYAFFSDSSKYFLEKFGFTLVNGANRIYLISKEELTFAFNEKTLTANNLKSSMFIYALDGDNTLYSYDTYLKTSRPEFVLPSGSVVTNMMIEPMFIYDPSGKLVYDRQLLFVGVSTPGATNEGSVYIFNVADNSLLTLEKSYLNIAGKIVSMCYKYY